jgi:hypothetical protein
MLSPEFKAREPPGAYGLPKLAFRVRLVMAELL